MLNLGIVVSDKVAIYPASDRRLMFWQALLPEGLLCFESNNYAAGCSMVIF